MPENRVKEHSKAHEDFVLKYTLAYLSWVREFITQL